MEWISQNRELIGILLMPFTYGFVGWLTNVVALKMTFYPIRFVGIWEPYLGWQGIVPRKGKYLALKSVNMVTERLIKLDEFFSRVKPEKLEAEFQPVLDKELPDIAHKIIEEIHPDLKNHFTDKDLEEILKHAHEKTSHTVRDIAKTLNENVSAVFNFKNFVLKQLTGPNIKRLVDIFQEVGHKEFKFIEKSGWIFGSLLGIGQAILWNFFPIWWTLPLQGVIVGYLTNWIALNMIFRPLYPRKFLWLTYQGLFLKRQEEVSKAYCSMFANDVLTAKNVLSEILYRRAAKTVFEEVYHAVEETLTHKNDEEAKKLLHAEKAMEVQKKIVEEVTNHLASQSSTLAKYMERALNVEKMMYERMKSLPPEEFEEILRSAFKEDEYILILIGSVLGALVGLGQALYMLAVA
ncbi:MAG: DUF445 family protein [Candidatus Hydrogenedentota bacterium]|nr:MAG: DUF445 family protein [Candidatus Hydrogenedentota bacterium]